MSVYLHVCVGVWGGGGGGGVHAYVFTTSIVLVVSDSRYISTDKRTHNAVYFMGEMKSSKTSPGGVNRS